MSQYSGKIYIKVSNSNDWKKLKKIDNSKMNEYWLCDAETFFDKKGQELILNTGEWGIDEFGIENFVKDIVDILKDNCIVIGMTCNFNVDYDQIYNNVINVIASSEANLNNISSDNLSYIMIEFYTLIAMAALYGGVISMFITNYKLANMSAVGKRTSITPIHKGSMLLGSLLASYFVQLIGIGLLFLYTIFVLNVDYGSNLLLVILLALVGSLAGLALGVFVATIFKTNENTKMGILIAFTMLCSFLSGMMGITMKYVVDKNIPILNIINPASMITDGFYSLYYYDTLDRFYFNLISLIIFSALMIFISYSGLRRQKYDSI